MSCPSHFRVVGLRDGPAASGLQTGVRVSGGVCDPNSNRLLFASINDISESVLAHAKNIELLSTVHGAWIVSRES